MKYRTDMHYTIRPVGRQLPKLTAFLAILLTTIAAPSFAQHWSDGGWSHVITSSSTTGYVVNSNPGVSAVAPSGSPAVLHCYVTAEYTLTLTAAMGWNSASTVHHNYNQSGSVSNAAEAHSYFAFLTGGVGNNATAPAQDYDTGTVDLNTNLDYQISPPGGDIVIDLTANCQVNASTFSASCSSGAGTTYSQ